MLLLFQIPENLEGPAWFVSTTLGLSLISHFILKPFFAFFYKDFLKDYWRKKLEIQNADRANIMGYSGVIDMVEGKYHLLARQLISYTIVVSERYRECELDDTDIIRQLRINMRDSMQRTRADLGRYTSAVTGGRLNLHLERMAESETLGFYSPIVTAIHETKGQDMAKLRDVILSQIDMITTEALVTLTTKNGQRKEKTQKEG